MAQAREWITVAIAAGALALGVYTCCRVDQLESTQSSLRAEQLLNEAWDLLGGKRGTTAVLGFESDSNKLEEARRRIALALESKPENPRALTMMGSYYNARGMRNDAIRNIDSALELDPNHLPALVSKGLLLVDEGRFEEAAKVYQRAAALDSRHPQRAYVFSNLGVALEKQNKDDEALAAYRRSLEIDPKNAFAHNSVGNILWKRGDFSGAEASYRRAIQHNTFGEGA